MVFNEAVSLNLAFWSGFSGSWTDVSWLRKDAICKTSFTRVWGSKLQKKNISRESTLLINALQWYIFYSFIENFDGSYYFSYGEKNGKFISQNTWSRQ